MKKIIVHDIVPKELSFILELTELQLLQLKMILDHSQIDYNSEQEPGITEAIVFLKETLYPFLNKIQEKQIEEL